MRVRREAVPDAAQIARVRVRSWRAAYRGPLPQDHLDGLDLAERRERWSAPLAGARWPHAGTLAAELGDRIVGFVNFRPARDDDLDPEAVGEIAAISLDPGVFGQGVGRRLIPAALARPAEGGRAHAALWVLDGNPRARRFHEAGGWRRDGAVKVDTGRGFPITEVRCRREAPGPGPA